MSVATEFAPVVYIPSRARPCEPPLATVVTLHRPSAGSIRAPLRLTRRGVLALAGLVAALSIAVTGLAWLSAPSAPSPTSRLPAPDSVTVQSGDTLWSIASRVAPRRDPRAEVAELQRVNGLTGVQLMAGQVLRTH